MPPDLYPYQREGAEFLASRRAACLADDPGLGKTSQTITACDLVSAQRILIICPAVAVPVWRHEFPKWADPAKPRNVVVWSYDLVARDQHLLASLRAVRWDVLILDEAHYLRTPNTKRTRAVYGFQCEGAGGLVARAERTWALSGTFMLNHAGELYPHLRALSPDRIKDLAGLAGFSARYVRTKRTPWGDKPCGSMRIPELRERLVGLFLRRTKAQVLPDLPPMRIEMLPGEVAAPSPQVPGPITEEQAEQALEDPGALSRERHELGRQKVPHAIKWTDEFLTTNLDKKLLVWCYHRDVLDSLVSGLAAHRPLVIHGAMPQAARGLIAEEFQGTASRRLFIGQIQAAGVAITLTAAQDEIIVEPSWVPAENAQAAARAHRIGQTGSVLCRVLYLPGTLDETIIKVLVRKTRDVKNMLG